MSKFDVKQGWLHKKIPFLKTHSQIRELANITILAIIQTIAEIGEIPIVYWEPEPFNLMKKGNDHFIQLYEEAITLIFERMPYQGGFVFGVPIPTLRKKTAKWLHNKRRGLFNQLVIIGTMKRIIFFNVFEALLENDINQDRAQQLRQEAISMGIEELAILEPGYCNMVVSYCRNAHPCELLEPRRGPLHTPFSLPIRVPDAMGKLGEKALNYYRADNWAWVKNDDDQLISWIKTKITNFKGSLSGHKYVSLLNIADKKHQELLMATTLTLERNYSEEELETMLEINRLLKSKKPAEQNEPQSPPKSIDELPIIPSKDIEEICSSSELGSYDNPIDLEDEIYTIPSDNEDDILICDVQPGDCQF